jgi:hypothetical protein
LEPRVAWKQEGKMWLFWRLPFSWLRKRKFTLRTRVEHVSHIIITHRVFHLGLELWRRLFVATTWLVVIDGFWKPNFFLFIHWSVNDWVCWACSMNWSWNSMIVDTDRDCSDQGWH